MIVHQIEKRGEYKMRREAPDEVTREEYEKKCQSCGACCSYYSWRARGIPVDDGGLLNDAASTFTAKERIKFVKSDGTSHIETHVRAFMRRRKVGGWWLCINLQGIVGQSVKCGAYDKRPSACSNFQPGSPLCLIARKWAGLEAKGVEVAA